MTADSNMTGHSAPASNSCPGLCVSANWQRSSQASSTEEGGAPEGQQKGPAQRGAGSEQGVSRFHKGG